MYTGISRRLGRIIQSVVSGILLALGGLVTCSGAIVTLLTLFGQMGTDSVGEYFFKVLISLMITAFFAGIAWAGWKLRPKKTKGGSPAPGSSSAPQKPAAMAKTAIPPVSHPREKRCMLCKEVISDNKMHAQGLCRKCLKLEEKIRQAREKMDGVYQAFLESDGKLPQGFSAPYLRHTARYYYHTTPFDAYVDEITRDADSVSNRSGFSDWLHWDASAEIDAAAAEIANWAHLHREIRTQLQEMCRIGNTTILPPLPRHCSEKVMVILDDAELFRDISDKSLEACKAAGVSFCTLLSDRKLYDLTEQKEKGVSAVSYPNYHDETYADWYFIDNTSYDWRYL